MASSSFSRVKIKYGVYLNFRGEDTGNNFTSHLYTALEQKGISTFFYQSHKGEKTSEALFTAIEESAISIVIFSKNYASSAWCLEELSKIVECRERNGQLVLPIFYHVEPSDVWNQRGHVQEAFDRHEDRFKDETEKVKRWRAALSKDAEVSGFHLDKYPVRAESEVIQEIVEDISRKLTDMNYGIHQRGRQEVYLKWIIVITNFLLELPSTVFDQLSSVQKPQYALISMLFSLISMLVCIVEHIIKGWKETTVIDIIGLACAIPQFIVTAINYSFVHRNADSPIKISVWPIIFASGLLCSKVLERRN